MTPLIKPPDPQWSYHPTDNNPTASSSSWCCSQQCWSPTCTATTSQPWPPWCRHSSNCLPSLSLSTTWLPSFRTCSSWLRTTLSSDNPYLCIVGSFTSSVSSMILGTSSSKFLVNWFRAEIFTHLIYLSTLCSVLSLSAGLFLPGLILSSASTQ
jgi:hypothetical protein